MTSYSRFEYPLQDVWTRTMFLRRFRHAAHGICTSNRTHDPEFLHEPTNPFEIVGQTKVELKRHLDLASALLSPFVLIGEEENLVGLFVSILLLVSVAHSRLADVGVVAGTRNLCQVAEPDLAFEL